MCDADIESSSVVPTPSGLLSPEIDKFGRPICPSCKIPKITADSRSHRWTQQRYHYSLSALADVFRMGSTLGCNICRLVVDALNAWTSQDPHRLSKTRWRYIIDTSYGQPGYNFRLHTDNESLIIFCGEGNESPWNLNMLPHISGDTSSPQALNTIRRWTRTCENEHENCKRNNLPEFAPKRLLALINGRVRLCEDIDSPPPYACLSHCWGPVGPALKLESTTAVALKAGLSLGQLPKTFHDAVVLCIGLNIDHIWIDALCTWRRAQCIYPDVIYIEADAEHDCIGLNIDHIWIDALCILQDNQEDWEECASSMADVYANAIITIAATWSNDSNCGCFSQTGNDFKAIPLKEQGLFVRRRFADFSELSRVSFSKHDTGTWPLLSRAWVYQERKLSARVVHMGKNQLYWECDTAYSSEDTLGERINFPYELKSKVEDPTQAWRYAVEHYSSLALSFESDRLPAISAIVKRMQPLREGDVYVAGMWMKSLLDDLVWQSDHTSKLPRPDISRPTWSWISVGAGVYWRYPSDVVLSSVQLVDLNYQVIGPAHFGHAPNARITIRGPATAVEISRFQENPPNFRLIDIPTIFLDKVSGALSSRDFDYGTANPPILHGEGLVLLLLKSSNSPQVHPSRIGIVLRMVDEATYNRVGRMSIRHHPFDFNDHLVVYAEQDRVLTEFVASLPIREFTIV